MGNTERDTPQEEKQTNPTTRRELATLAFWKKEKLFEKSQRGLSPKGWFATVRERLFGKRRFVFYDGPPFATGLPHYGHLLASVIKDAVPRYWTMRGYRVDRRWGWDCHGLPLEVEIEKRLGLRNKREIQEYGIDAFNAHAREAIGTYESEWKKVIARIGRWVDMENDYKTVTTDYIESVWHIFHTLHTRGCVYQGRKVLHFCPRCSTTLSNNEVADCYQDTDDTAVYVTFPLTDDPTTHFVAWTTTPWTLFGNAALVVHKDLSYAYVKKGENRFIVHEKQAHVIANGTVEKVVSGDTLVGLSYTPLYKGVYTGEESGIWKVYHAPFVDAETGTGIVHIAPAYGEDDLQVARKHHLPVTHHIDENGQFMDSVQELVGQSPKSKGRDEEVTQKIITVLNRHGRILKEEVVQHSYPFCWRCDTPLLHYATTSWFIDVPKYRNAMVAANKNIRWVPSHIRDGRFGNWVANAKEWAVSRPRFWGAPIPAWKSASGKHLIIDSLETMMNHMRSKNTYIFVRHGECQGNEEGYYNCLPNEKNILTKRGRRQAFVAGQKLKAHNPTMIIASPATRTRQTAAIIQETLEVPVREDPAVCEIQAPFFDGKSITKFVTTMRERVKQDGIEGAPSGGESYVAVYRRVEKFLRTLEQTHTGETIVIVTHKSCVTAAKMIAVGRYPNTSFYLSGESRKPLWRIPNCEVAQIPYRLVHRDADGAVDLHRPFIDTVVLYDSDGESYHHVGSVFDCWFESGSMPYASNHYPFALRETKSVFNPKTKTGFPADFIAEGLDQTRGWFYNLLAIGVGAFGVAPYKNVVVFGLIRAADGKKMSKRLKNYTDPNLLIDRYGADALRHYFLASPVVRGEDIDFKDDSVAEIHRKVYLRLDNCLHFYTTYSTLPHQRRTEGTSQSTHLLDRFILSRVADMHRQVSRGFSNYELDGATSAIAPFIEDLSAWYLRRSRDRLRSETADGVAARETLWRTLFITAKTIAPIAPLYAEHLYQALGVKGGPDSVHLCHWEEEMPIDRGVIEKTETIRSIVSKAHEQRSSAGIKVRQPLALLEVPTTLRLDSDTKTLLQDEVNVKEVRHGKQTALDITITQALQSEGFAREFIRKVQDLRKELAYKPLDHIATLTIAGPSVVIEQLRQHETLIATITRAKGISYAPTAKHTFSLNDLLVSVSLEQGR